MLVQKDYIFRNLVKKIVGKKTRTELQSCEAIDVRQVKPIPYSKLVPISKLVRDDDRISMAPNFYHEYVFNEDTIFKDGTNIIKDGTNFINGTNSKASKCVQISKVMPAFKLIPLSVYQSFYELRSRYQTLGVN